MFKWVLTAPGHKTGYREQPCRNILLEKQNEKLIVQVGAYSACGVRLATENNRYGVGYILLENQNESLIVQVGAYSV